MHFGTLNGAISMDFADILLIVNVFAIALLLGMLYIDEIATACKRATRLLSPHALLQRMRFWVKATRASH